jgi:endonuclease/exonuclease/phosphatase family metal-dependent hydrolase
MVMKTMNKGRTKFRFIGIIAGIIVLSFSNFNALYAPEPTPSTFHENEPKAIGMQVRILSWNIAMLPIVDFVHSDGNRASKIGKALQKKDYEILVFQEAFSAYARRVIYRNLCRLYPFQYGPANSGVALKINSGVWILSKIPLKIIKEYKFSGCEGFDCLSRKGALLLEGSINDQAFQIIGTHLESDDSNRSVRMLQLDELYDSVVAPYTRPGIPQFICGDFNTDRELSEDYTNMLNTLRCEDGNLTGEQKITFGFPLEEDSLKSREKPRQLDYILTKNSDRVESINRKVSVIKEYLGRITNNLSDHYGIEAVIQFKRIESIF